MAARAWIPERGEVVWISFESTAGHEQRGQRPAVIVTPRAYNHRAGLAIVCAVTSRAKGYPFEVQLPPDLPVKGVVLADQVRTIDWRARGARFACALPDEAIEEVLGKLHALLA